MARAAAYGAWRATPRGEIPAFPDVMTSHARAMVREFLCSEPAGGWLSPGTVAELLTSYGLGPVHRDIAIQPMITGGTEVLVRVADDHVFGPLVVFGLGGVATNVLADHAARLAPLTTTDADALIHSVWAAPLLLGYRGAPAADLDALRDLLLRISRLAEDLPEITELDLNPVIARPDGTFIVDARIKLTPCEPQDPFLRRLR